MRRTVFLVTLLTAFTAAAELPMGEQVIHTRDGRELRGIIISETQQGYLLKMGERTELVPFASIQDMVPAEGSLPPAPPPPPPPVEPSRPGYESLPPPPRTPDQPPPPPEAEAAGPDWRAERRGFHWSVGAGGMVDPGIFGSGGGSTVTVAGYVAGFAAVRFGFGWLDVQAELMPMGFFRSATKALFINLNPQLRINFARFYSLGVGIWGGATVIPTVEFVTGFSVAPAIFRFGDLGQHEIRFWIGSPALATTPSLRAGTVLLLLLSYAYVF